MWKVIVTRGTFATRSDAAAYAADIAQHDAKRVISVAVTPSGMQERQMQADMRRARKAATA